MKYTITFLVIFLSLFKVYSQKEWTLEECINYARENNLTIRLQQLNVDMAKLSLTQSKAALLPGVNASATHSYNYGQTVDRFTNQFVNDRVQSNNFYVSGNVTVFNGFILLNSWKQKMIDLQASQFDAEQIEDDISLNIASAYLQILYNMEMVDNAMRQLEVTKLQVERTTMLYEAGSVSKGDLLSMEAQLASEEATLISAQNQLDLSYLTLAQMLYLEDVNSFHIAVPEIALSDSNLMTLESPDNIYNYALNNQPEIKASELRVESAQKSLQIARGARYPSLTLSGSWGTGYSSGSQSISGFNIDGIDTIGYTSESPTELVYTPAYSYEYEVTPFADQIRDNVNKTVGLNLTIPLFNGLSTHTNIQLAKISLETAQINFEQSKLNLRQTIQQAHADAMAAFKNYLAAAKQVSALREAFIYMEERYNVGMATPVEYSDSKNRLIEAESQLLQSKYEYVFRTRILDFYLGKEIKI
ncbi:MAG: hypothetical protein C0592_10990 [Marinilabiliales bacterium]|nr:MAG: hypothetical protein C0592_10990 [Marinilabiliales bacterium]